MTTGFVVRPSASLTLGYVGVSTFWLIGAFLTTPHGPVGTPLRIITDLQAVGLSVADGVLLLALVADGLAVRRHPSFIRRPQLVGICLAVVCLLLFQYGVILARDLHAGM